MIASHYAEPLPRVIGRPATLRSGPGPDCDSVAELESGDSFDMLDNSLGWAWGYGGPERLVGYVESEALSPLPAREG
ncbi:MAG TPA: SH3 domain-containing protein [Sphingomicrobium sp.]|nr:SH3 domain-containing protein [Sphingomicrobium sp.]